MPKGQNERNAKDVPVPVHHLGLPSHCVICDVGVGFLVAVVDDVVMRLSCYIRLFVTPSYTYDSRKMTKNVRYVRIHKMVSSYIRHNYIKYCIITGYEPTLLSVVVLASLEASTRITITNIYLISGGGDL